MTTELCRSPLAQVQVLSAALKAAQLDSPSDDSPTESQPVDSLADAEAEIPLAESKSVEVQPEADEILAEEEEQATESHPVTETCPVQEQGDVETQTEPPEDAEESPPDSPVLV